MQRTPLNQHHFWIILNEINTKETYMCFAGVEKGTLSALSKLRSTSANGRRLGQYFKYHAYLRRTDFIHWSMRILTKLKGLLSFYFNLTIRNLWQHTIIYRIWKLGVEFVRKSMKEKNGKGTVLTSKVKEASNMQMLLQLLVHGGKLHHSFVLWYFKSSKPWNSDCELGLMHGGLFMRRTKS